MRTSFTELVGCDFPLVAFSHCRDVVAAVTDAGGFGVFGSSRYDPAELEIELSWIDEHTGGRPYGVDMLIPQKFDIDDSANAIPQGHRAFLDELLQKFDVPPLPADQAEHIQNQVKKIRSMRARADELWEVAGNHPVSLYAAALGTVPPHLAEQAHRKGAVVGGLVGSVAHAERQKAAGADFVVAQGYEAGGHCGEITTMVLIPDVVDMMGDTPVLAAGGIGSGRQMAAAMAMGAAGVWTGSVWLTTRDAETHPVIKEKFLNAGAGDTVRSRSSTGKPARQLRSAWTDAWEDPANPKPLGMPQHRELIAEAKERIDRAAYNHPGAKDLANYFVGQVVGRMNSVKSAQQVVQEFMAEFSDTVERLAGLAS